MTATVARIRLGANENYATPFSVTNYLLFFTPGDLFKASPALKLGIVYKLRNTIFFSCILLSCFILAAS